MGNFTRALKNKRREDLSPEIKILNAYFYGDITLDALFNYFDTDGNNLLEGEEFFRLTRRAMEQLYNLQYPNRPRLKLDKMEPLVKKYHLEVLQRTDTDRNGVITRDEFITFANMLRNDYESIEREMRENGRS